MKERYEFKLNELQKHLEQLTKNIKYIDAFYGFPLSCKEIEIIMQSSDLDKLDSIAYRTLKFQDTLGRVIKLFFALSAENTETLTMIDLINFAQKLGFSIDVKFFREFRALRNALTHEYVEDCEELASVLNKLKDYLPRLEKILEELKERNNF